MSKKKPAIQQTLDARGRQYGEFSEHAAVTQSLKACLYSHAESVGVKLSATHREAIDMICHKLGRIVNGNPDLADSWHDIAGYATLVEQRVGE